VEERRIGVHRVVGRALVAVVAAMLVQPVLGPSAFDLSAEDSVPVYLLNLKVRQEAYGTDANDAPLLTANVDVCVDDGQAPSWRNLAVAAAPQPISLTPAVHTFRVFPAADGADCTGRAVPPLVEAEISLVPAEGKAIEAEVIALVPVADKDANKAPTFRLLQPRDDSYSCPGGLAYVHAAESRATLTVADGVFTLDAGGTVDYTGITLEPPSADLHAGFTNQQDPGTMSMPLTLNEEPPVTFTDPIKIDPTRARTLAFVYGGPTGPRPVAEDEEEEAAAGEAGAETADPTAAAAAPPVHGIARLDVPVDCPNTTTTTTSTTTTTTSTTVAATVAAAQESAAPVSFTG
jgi:hypothetical protein